AADSRETRQRAIGRGPRHQRATAKEERLAGEAAATDAPETGAEPTGADRNPPGRRPDVALEEVVHRAHVPLQGRHPVGARVALEAIVHPLEPGDPADPAHELPGLAGEDVAGQDRATVPH